MANYFCLKNNMIRDYLFPIEETYIHIEEELLENLVVMERVGAHIALVTLNRPDACNAINGPLACELERAATEIERDPSIWVAILMGAGPRAFCAGADLKAVAAGRVAELSTPNGGFAGFTRLRRRKVWLAAVHASVLAGGLEIMLACDFAIAAEGSSFGLPEVRRGLVATEGGLYKLGRILPRSLALRMIATGAPIDAQQALLHGLVTEIVPADALRHAAIALATTICENSPAAVGESLSIARDSPWQDDDMLDRRCRETLARLANTADFIEGATAFAEHRAPRWQGL